MRPAPALALLLLLAMPLGLAAAPLAPGPAVPPAPAAPCSHAHDAPPLPLPHEAAAWARAAGLDPALVRPLGPAPLPGHAGLQGAPGLGTPQEELHACTGRIRPGAPLTIAGLGSCTLNWVLRDGAGRLYVGTAGHCVPHLGFQEFGVAGVAQDIGEAIYTTGNGGVGHDFAVLRIDPRYHDRVTPTMCHWGGPVKMGSPADAIVLGDTAILHYGWGFVYGSTPYTRARAGELPWWGWGEDSLTFVAAIAPGDSGSAFQTYNGGAAGVVTHGLLLPGPAPVGLGLGFGSRLDVALARARAATGLDLQLATSLVPVDLTGQSVP